MKSPFESKIPAHIQRSLSSPSGGDPQPALPRPCNARGYRVSSGHANSLAALTHGNGDMGFSLEKAPRAGSIPAQDPAMSTRKSTSGADRTSGLVQASSRAPWMAGVRTIDTLSATRRSAQIAHIVCLGSVM